MHEAIGPSAVSLRGGVAADGLAGGLLPSMGGLGAGGEVELCKLWGMLEFLACLPETASTPEDRCRARRSHTKGEPASSCRRSAKACRGVTGDCRASCRAASWREC